MAYYAVATTRKAASRLTNPQLLVSYCDGWVYCVAQCALVQSINLLPLLKQCIEMRNLYFLIFQLYKPLNLF